MRQSLRGCSESKTFCFLKIIYCLVLVGQQCEFEAASQGKKQTAVCVDRSQVRGRYKITVFQGGAFRGYKFTMFGIMSCECYART